MSRWISLFGPLLLLPLSVCGQAITDIPGWHPLSDSLMQIWHLDKDQMRRIKVIQEDYATERKEIWGTPNMEDAEKVRTLTRLGTARMEEIRGVLGTANYERWQQVLKAAVAGSPGN